MFKSSKKRGYTSPTNQNSSRSFWITMLFLVGIFISVTLAFFFNDDFANRVTKLTGAVRIEAVGRGDTYNSIEDTTISRLVISLEDGYKVLIPGMQIDCQVNCRVFRSTTRPLLRAKFEISLLDEYGIEMTILNDPDNVSGDLTYQFDNIILSSGNWYHHTDTYYYYVGDNVVNPSSADDALLAEIDATQDNAIVHFIDDTITFPNYVTSDYSGFGVKIKVTFQAIQNFIPDDDGVRVPNTIRNSQKIFDDFVRDKIYPSSLEYFEVNNVGGNYTLSVKPGVVIPEPVVLPSEDADGHVITNVDNSFRNNQTIKSVIIPSTYTTISPNAFANSSVQTVDLSATSITQLSDSAFSGCSSLKSIILPSTLEVIGQDALMNTSITTLMLPNGLRRIESQGVYLTQLASIYIPESVEYIGSRAFNCQSLRSIQVDPNNLHYKGSSGKELLSKDGKNFIYFASGNKKLYEYYIPEGVETLNEQSFHMCSIYNLYIPSTLMTINNAFSYQSMFKKIIVHENNTNFCVADDCLLLSFDKSVAYKYAALNSRKIYTIPNEVLSIVNSNVFDSAQYLEEIYFGPNTNCTTSISINGHALRKIVVDSANTYIKDDNNVALLSKNGQKLISFVNQFTGTYTIPNGVKEIGAYAFYSVETDMNLILPNSVTTVQYSGICNPYKKIHTIEFKSSTPPNLVNNMFDSYPSDFVIKVPSSSLSLYRSATYYSTVASKIISA